MNKTHRPMLFISLSFAAGILLAQYASISFAGVVFAAAVFLLLSQALKRKPVIAIACIFFALASLGFIHTQNYRTLKEDDISRKSYYHKGPVQIEGTVISDVEKRKFFNKEKTVFTFKVSRIKTNWGWRRRSGKILVNVFREIDVRYGDYLVVGGKLHRPFDFSSDRHFSYSDYLNHRGVYLLCSVGKNGTVKVLRSQQGNVLKSFTLRAKNRLRGIFSQYLTPNESAIMQAIILGDRYDIPQHVRELFVMTGTAHILAISGLHIGIVAFLIFVVVKMIPIPRRGHYLITIAVLLIYAVMTGARPSVVRATIMAVVFLMSFLAERETDSLNSLFLASFLILLINPMSLFDVGFQLSFISVFFIIMFYRVIFSALFKEPGAFKPKRNFRLFFKQSLAVSIAAWLGVAGLIAYYFDIVTPVTILANLLVIPLIGAVVTLGLGLLVSAIALPVCALPFASCLKVTLNFMVAGIFLLSYLPGAYFYIKEMPFYGIFLFYFFVIILLILIKFFNRNTRTTG